VENPALIGTWRDVVRVIGDIGFPPHPDLSPGGGEGNWGEKLFAAERR
jgi:hypothetical protein